MKKPLTKKTKLLSVKMQREINQWIEDFPTKREINEWIKTLPTNSSTPPVIIGGTGGSGFTTDFHFKAGKDAVNHPEHYGGEDNLYEAIKVIEAWKLGFHLGNTVKYISRAGKKDTSKELQDLEKALWYLQRRIENLKK